MSSHHPEYGLAFQMEPRSGVSPTRTDAHSRERSRARTSSQNTQWPSSSSPQPGSRRAGNGRKDGGVEMCPSSVTEVSGTLTLLERGREVSIHDTVVNVFLASHSAWSYHSRFLHSCLVAHVHIRLEAQSIHLLWNHPLKSSIVPSKSSVHALVCLCRFVDSSRSFHELTDGVISDAGSLVALQGRTL